MTKAERAERAAWLASLKAGDEVAVQPMERGKPAGSPYLHVVEWIADHGILTRPKGKPPTRNSELRWPRDTGTTPRDAYSLARRVEPVTESHRRTWQAEECRARLINEFDRYRCTVSDDKAIRMCAILDEPEPTAEGGAK